jgi:hypothetical protein
MFICHKSKARSLGGDSILPPSTLFNASDFSILNPLGESNNLFGIGGALLPGSGIPDIAILGAVGLVFLVAFSGR